MKNFCSKLTGVVFLLLFIAGSSFVFAISDDTVKTSHPISFFNQKGIEGSSTARVLSKSKGKSVGFTNPYNPSSQMAVFAGTFNGTFDGTSAKFYCIDIAHPVAFYSQEQPHEYTDNGGTISTITFILNNYYPYKSLPYPNALEEEKEAAAVQLAIWHFSDDVEISSITNSEIKTRVYAIVADANLNGNNMTAASAIAIVPGSQNLVKNTPAVFYAKILDGNGVGVAGLNVSFSATSGSLNNTTAVTDASGYTPDITLTQGAGNSSVVTASAVFAIPQGTKFVHKVSPDNYQMLVLAKPVVTNRSAQSGISWYTPGGGCDLTGYKTFTIGGWGSEAHGNNAGALRDQYFSQVFPNGMVVGSGFTVKFTSSAAVVNFLPAGGTSAALTQSYVNPAKNSIKNTLLSQVIGLKLAVAFNDYGVLGTNAVKIGDLVIAKGSLAGKTVYELLQLANTALGGGTTGYTYAELNEAATAFNENFDEGKQNLGYLTCNNPQSTADLSIAKTSSKVNPVVGDEVIFTITVTNNGPGNATNVKVSEILPSGFQYLSSTVSQGTYNNTDGNWNVGTLNNGANAVLTVTTRVNVVLINNGFFSLGPAVDYNVFILEDISQPSSDTQGKMAVGRNAYLSNYSIGDQLPIVGNSVDALVVGNNLQFESGAVYGGNIVYKTSTNLPKQAVSILDGDLIQGERINFTNVANTLQNLSLQLKDYTVNGTVTFAFYDLVLTGTDPMLNVFSVPDNYINNATSVEINAPNGSVVVVNFRGESIRWTGGLTVRGTDMTNVLYNFPEATALHISGIDVRGSILAPFAHVTFPAGVQNGQMIAKSLSGSGQFNLAQFIGYVPIEAEITNIAEVSDMDQLDPDSSPGNGATDEDDYSSVTMVVSGINSVGGGGSGTSANWTAVGQFASGELVWALGKDGSGNLLAGTWGGKLYRSTDNGLTWVRINDAMTVDYIWSIKTNAAGHIFVGTEEGVYRTTDNGSTWAVAGVANKEVRALLIDGAGAIYAGTWSSGIYKSTDNGATWNQVNNGLESMAVHALAINAAGEIFTGTYGTGLYKSTNNGGSWVNQNMGYDFVWTLGITSNGTILAGTYGKGVYRSTDNGATWAIVNDGLRGRFMYSIVIDGSNNAFVATWAGGVYVSTNNGETWYAVGLNGANVSSLTIATGNGDNPVSPVLYAGTQGGIIYKNENPLSNVKQINSAVPENFGLRQNYPNPFNPSTRIMFDVPYTSRVTLKVFNMLGEEIKTLISSEYGAGSYSVEFDARSLSSGVYIYRLTAGGVNITRKMLLQK